jgi:1,4-alpha-glucan branching enzyme
MTGLNDRDIAAIVDGTFGNPFSLLGPHATPDGLRITAFLPDALSVAVVWPDGQEAEALDCIDPAGLFSSIVRGAPSGLYQLDVHWDGARHVVEDPYRFGPVLGDLDEYLIAEGRHQQLYQRLGAHPVVHQGVAGTAFALWAPNARRVAVVGDFNLWDGRRHPMRRRLGGGLFELFIPGVEAGHRYKFEIIGANGTRLPLKTDPFGFYQETPPATASIVHGLGDVPWDDGDWLSRRQNLQQPDQPISIYEVHLGSWRRGADGALLDYATAAEELVDYVVDMGFTHVEFLPLTEHPFTGSWGYQPIGLFAPTSRFGSPEDFSHLVERLHRAGIGVIMDWVPAHFPSDAHGLARFDGTALYEHEDPRLGFHQDWNTLIYNFGRTEVANFLTSSALFWLDRFHVDGLRVDAVASMLYLDYSRKHGEWIPNRYGGNENLDAVSFLQEANRLVHETADGAVMIAEESTAWPGVSRPTEDGGLGFDYKWNMGWMHDTLAYMKENPLYRRHHHHKMTFGIHYGFSEKFVLPLSHDEVVHGKGSLLTRMPGDRWQKFANLRAYFGFMWGHPGKKLLFMGGEFAQEREWRHDYSLDWHLLDDPFHKGMQALVRALNGVYRREAALHQRDCDPSGFAWIEGGDTTNSVFSFLRYGDPDVPPVAVVANMTPQVLTGYRIGVPVAGAWQEILNTDDSAFGGSGVTNAGGIATDDQPWHGQPQSLTLTLPPLATLFLTPTRTS